MKQIDKGAAFLLRPLAFMELNQTKWIVMDHGFSQSIMNVHCVWIAVERLIIMV